LRQATFKEILNSSTQNEILSTKKLSSKLNQLGEALDEIVTPQQKTMLNNIIKEGNFVLARQKGMKTVEFLETLSGTSNEGIVNAIFKPNNTYNIRLARRLLSKERMDDVTSYAIEKVLKMSGTGNYLPVTSAKEFAKYETPLKELLPPNRYNALTDFLKLGQDMKRVEKLAENASQTGQVLLGSQIGAQILKNPLVSGKLIIFPWMLAKIYTSDMATKYFTRAIKINPYSQEAISNFIKALQIIGFNEGNPDKQKAEMP